MQMVDMHTHNRKTQCDETQVGIGYFGRTEQEA